MRIVSAQRTPLKNPTTADVEWGPDDAACFGELYAGPLNKEHRETCEKCDAQSQCWRAFKRKHGTRPETA